MYLFVGYPDACDRRTGNPRGLRASRPFYRRDVDLFVCFFRHRAHLLRRRPRRACTAACSKARADGVVAEVCQTVKTSASPLICSVRASRNVSVAAVKLSTYNFLLYSHDVDVPLLCLSSYLLYTKVIYNLDEIHAVVVGRSLLLIRSW